MAWVPMKEAARRLGVHEMTIKRRTLLPEEDPRYLPMEKEPYRNGERILVQLPDDAPAIPLTVAPTEAPQPSDGVTPSELPAVVDVRALLRDQSEAHERELTRRDEQRAAEIARLQEHHAGLLAAKDETITELRSHVDALTRRVLELERQTQEAPPPPMQEPTQPSERPWWRFWG
jgi:hypothetical protein